MLTETIRKLKIKRNAVILAHNYQRPEVQDAADFVGDSLGLSLAAARTGAAVIVFCGVNFMAQTAKIVSPQKIVLLPEPSAGCPMADMVAPEDVRALKARYPGAAVVCYVNTHAEVKAECDVCCTSANAVSVVQALLDKGIREIIFVPDKYLGGFAAAQLGYPLICAGGYCPAHVKVLPEDIRRQKRLHPEADVLVHPECVPEVTALADKVCSTEGICRHAGFSDRQEFIIGTEAGIIHRLKKENPQKKFYPATDLNYCVNMKKITLDKIIRSLEEMRFEVAIPREILAPAGDCVRKMLALEKENRLPPAAGRK